MNQQPICELLGIGPMSDDAMSEFKEDLIEWKKTRKRGWYNNQNGRRKGSKNINPYPETDAVKQRRAKQSKKVWINNGTHSTMHDSDTPIPVGYVRGRLNWKK